jgi:hypothetical protein
VEAQPHLDLDPMDAQAMDAAKASIKGAIDAIERELI